MTTVGNFNANPYQILPPQNSRFSVNGLTFGTMNGSSVVLNGSSGLNGTIADTGYNNSHHVPMSSIAPVTSVFSGYTNIASTQLSGVPNVASAGHVSDVSNTSKSSKSAKGAAGAVPRRESTARSSPVSPTIVVNACLTFIYSEKQRKNQHSILESVSKNFTLNEIKSAREALFRGSGVTHYRYQPPHNPATAQQTAAHCVGSIISKLNELDFEFNQPPIKIVCPSEELFSLFNVYKLVYNPSESCPMEDRVSALEKDMKMMKSTSSISNQLQPKAHSNTFNSRQNLINDVRNSNFPSTPSSTKRPRSADKKDSWEDVVYKRNGERPQKRIKPSFWGKEDTATTNDLLGAEIHDVFLFNYKNLATDDVVKKHFEKHGIKVLKIYQRSREGSDVKSFVMRLANKADFDKVVAILPWQTGARWYERLVRDPAQRPSAYFNKAKASDAFLLERPSSGMVTPGSNIRVDATQLFYTPLRGAETPATPAAAHTPATPAAAHTPATPAAAHTPADVSYGTPFRSAAMGLSVTRMITPLTATSSVSSAPAFRVGGPLSNVGQSLSMSNLPMSMTKNPGA